MRFVHSTEREDPIPASLNTTLQSDTPSAGPSGATVYSPESFSNNMFIAPGAGLRMMLVTLRSSVSRRTGPNRLYSHSGYVVRFSFTANKGQ